MKSAIKGKTVKSLSNIKWSARSDATTAFKEIFIELRQLLQDFTLDDNETKSDSSYLKKVWMPQKQPYYVFYGTKSFKRFHNTSKSLQRADMPFGSGVALYNGTESFCQHIRDEIDTIEKNGLKLSTRIQKTYASQNKRNRKMKKTFDYEGEDTGCTRALEDAHESFRIGTYLPIFDTLIAE